MSRGQAKPPDIAAFVAAVAGEIPRARGLFPDPRGLVAALLEETGELARALLEETPARVFAEAAQVAAVAGRLALEGDPGLDPIRQARGLATIGKQPEPETKRKKQKGQKNG